MIKVKYSELYPYEFKERLNQNPWAYLPLGSLEYHGYHNVLGLDSLKVEKICEMAAQRFGGIVFPAVNLGFDIYPNLDLKEYPNKQYDCYHLNEDSYIDIINQYCSRMQHIGFKKIFVLAGHYPNARLLSDHFSNRENIFLYTEAELVGEKGDHAGKWETSLMMYLFPNGVNLDLMKNKKNRLMAVNGIDPIEASKEYGEKMVKRILDAIGEIINAN